MELALTFSEADIAALADLLDLGGPQGMRGMVDGRAQMKGSLAVPRVSADLRVQGLRVGSVDAGQGSLDFDWNGPAHDLVRLAASVEGRSGSLRVAKAHGPAGESVSLRARGFNLSLFRPLVPYEVPFSGDLTADMDLSGNLLNPELRGRFEVKHGTLSAVSFDAFTGAVRGKDGVYHLDDFVLAKGSHRAYLSGEVPVRRDPGGRA